VVERLLVSLPHAAARTALLAKLSKGDTFYKPPPNIFVKRARAPPLITAI
jgi:hypothetical protein